MKPRTAPIKDVIEDVISKFKAGRGSQAEMLNSAWAKAIGEENLRHAKPAELKEETLIVNVDSSSWLHKLSMEKLKILGCIKGDLGEGVIKDIKFRIGDL